ncbi:MAG: hypothetical protein GAK41_00083 [Burkholderia gladioli]|nr:MAG: hypothetical protein GAK41_00083 [Burkholderia gladioli]
MKPRRPNLQLRMGHRPHSTLGYLSPEQYELANVA